MKYRKGEKESKVIQVIREINFKCKANELFDGLISPDFIEQEPSLCTSRWLERNRKSKIPHSLVQFNLCADGGYSTN